MPLIARRNANTHLISPRLNFFKDVFSNSMRFANSTKSSYNVEGSPWETFMSLGLLKRLVSRGNVSWKPSRATANDITCGKMYPLHPKFMNESTASTFVINSNQGSVWMWLCATQVWSTMAYNSNDEPTSLHEEHLWCRLQTTARNAV